jgi:hypothetical protein
VQKKKPPGQAQWFQILKRPAPLKRGAGVWYYEPEVMLEPMLENFVLMMVPNAGIAATRAKAIAEAIRAYSIAVAPDSSFMKRTNLFI